MDTSSSNRSVVEKRINKDGYFVVLTYPPNYFIAIQSVATVRRLRICTVKCISSSFKVSVRSFFVFCNQ